MEHSIDRTKVQHTPFLLDKETKTGTTYMAETKQPLYHNSTARAVGTKEQ
jgi:hypothetical protein